MFFHFIFCSFLLYFYFQIQLEENKMNSQSTSILKRCLRLSVRNYSSSLASKLVQLTKRGVFEVKGRDSAKLLQGLITNDISLLTKTNRVIHSYLLNVQGRIINDVFIYNGDEENEYLFECDKSQCDILSHHLKKYKLRSKVKFTNRDDLNVFSIFGNNNDYHSRNQLLYLDPRIKDMGYRIITVENIDTVAEGMENPISISTEETYYKHRYCLGLSEGIAEVENGIPLEHNGAFCNSISFNKGCYVGQELVARANFTGVIRKRIMPVTLETVIDLESLNNTTIFNEKGKRAGKILGTEGVSGIGLLKLNEALNGQRLSLRSSDNEIFLRAYTPDWWPE